MQLLPDNYRGKFHSVVRCIRGPNNSFEQTRLTVSPELAARHNTLVLSCTRTGTADTDNWTKLRRLHHHQPEHVSACLGSAALRGGYDDDSILRLTRDD